MLKTNTSKGKGRMHTVDMTTSNGLELNVLQTEVLENRSIEGSPEDLMEERFKKLGATIATIKREEITLASRYPAVRLEVTVQGVTATMILTASSNSHYMLSAQSRGSRLNRDQFEKISARFFQSFRIQDEE